MGAQVEVTSDAEAAVAADGLLVPGVGAYAACMAGLRRVDGDQIIAERVRAGAPVLGVCVGMQILFAHGVEFGVDTAGCAQWPGAVTRLDAPVIPHMGWNVVDAAAAAPCSPASTPTPGSTSCTPTPRRAGRAARRLW